MQSRKELVRREAYLLWLAEGKPEGRDQEHWEEAERLVDRIEAARREDQSRSAEAVGAPLGPGQA